MLESESVAAVAMLNMRRLVGIVPQVTSVTFSFRQCSYVISNHEVGYLYPLLWVVRVTIIVETCCIGGKYIVVLYLYSIRYGRYSGVRSLNSNQLFSSLRALERKNMLKTVPQKRFTFSPSSINNSPYKINFSLDLPLKNRGP